MPVRRHPVAMTDADNRMLHVPLDYALIARLRSSYAALRSHELRLAETFYATLFESAPELRPMFRGDISAQAGKLTASLDAIVQSLEAPARNAEVLNELGRRHAGYGARPEHYDLVIDCLISAMRTLLGENADPRTLDEWRTALQLVSSRMIAATNASSPPAPQAPR